jgi:hypothetical protein
MLNQETITKAILTWVEDFVEKPHPNLGNWPPCPYARQARMSKNILVLRGTDPYHDAIDLAKNYTWDKEIVIYWYDPTNHPAIEFAKKIKQVNTETMPLDVVALEDHPYIDETISGVKMNFGVCALMILQQLSKVNAAADQLKTKDYYNHWDQDNLDKIVTWRYK